jgi:alkyl hydroperoxide reductase subunit AhpC
MALKIGCVAPNFTADTTQGMINFYEWMNNSWTIVLSHPKNFTPVCTSELLWIAQNIHEFASRNIKIISLSVDKLIQNGKWIDDIKTNFKQDVTLPLIADKNMRIAKLYNMLYDDNIARGIYIISPDKKVKALLNYPLHTGRNFNELLRIMDSLIATVDSNIATPVNWQPGENYLTTDEVQVA